MLQGYIKRYDSVIKTTTFSRQPSLFTIWDFKTIGKNTKKHTKFSKNTMMFYVTHISAPVRFHIIFYLSCWISYKCTLCV